MKPWRVGFAVLGLVLSILFCMPVIAKTTKGGKIDYTNKRLLIQLGILLGDASLGVVTLVVSLLRSEWLIITNLVLLASALLPTVVTVGFAGVPVFTSWCCCFGLDMCLVADTRLKTITSDPENCQSCQPWEFVTDEFTLFFLGSSLVLICLVFLISTTCFWRSSFMKEENEMQFFLERNRRVNTSQYIRQEDFQTAGVP